MIFRKNGQLAAGRAMLCPLDQRVITVRPRLTSSARKFSTVVSSGRWKGKAGIFVVGDEVDLGRDAVQQAHQLPGLGRGIVDAAQQHVFAGEALAAFFRLEIGQQAVQVLRAGKPASARRADSASGAFSEKAILTCGKSCLQLFKVFQDADRGHGDMARRNIQSRRRQ